MTTWLAVLLVGAGSYLFRLIPLLLAGRVSWPDPVDRGLQHAGRAALVYLVVSAVLGSASASPAATAGACAGVLITLMLGLRGHRLAIVMIAGLVAWLAVAGVVGLLS